MEIFTTALLVQQCDWTQAWRAVRRLGDNDLLTFPALAEATPSVVERLITPVAFAPTKSKRLVALSNELVQRQHPTVESWLNGHRDTEILRKELLSLQGIGEETADCILLYAGEHPVFVVDAYTRRVFSRLGLFPDMTEQLWHKASYRTLQEFFAKAISQEMPRFEELQFNPDVPLSVAVFRDFHAQIVELAKHHCLRSKPRCHVAGINGWNDYFFCESHCNHNGCDRCPLSHICAIGKEG